MRIGPTELLLVGAIIVVMLILSRSKKAAEEAKAKAEAERLAKAKAVPGKQPIKYPQLQLLGILVILAGVAMAVLAYLSEQQILGTLSIAGVGVLILGIAFIILARRR
jgi:Ca2+/Na+ antiporter